MSGSIGDIATKLRRGDRRIAVWGTGFIGYSTLAYFGDAGVPAIGYDIDATRVERIEGGEAPVHYDLESWLGFDTGQLVEEGIVGATTNPDEVTTADTPVHFVAVPTEQNGMPWDGALRDTVETIAAYGEMPEEPILVVIESTLTPGMTDDVVVPAFVESSLELGEDVFLGVAPRRDWFVDEGKKLPDIPRAIGGYDDRTTAYMEAVLGIVCDDLVPAPDYAHAELIKCIENAYRHVGITLANQLDRAYPDIDMRTVLQIVGTKWNVPTYFPSVGIGGYCVPVASQYVLSGTDRHEELSLLTETVETDRQQPYLVADAIAAHGAERVAVLGLAYKGDLKVDVLSPTVPIVSRLQDLGVDVRVNDPYYDDDHIEKRVGAPAARFPDDLGDVDAVLLTADHRRYRYLPDNRILEALDDCSLVIDNCRLWADIPFEEHEIEYFYTGDAGWLGSVTMPEAEPGPRLTEQ